MATSNSQNFRVKNGLEVLEAATFSNTITTAGITSSNSITAQANLVAQANVNITGAGKYLNIANGQINVYSYGAESAQALKLVAANSSSQVTVTVNTSTTHIDGGLIVTGTISTVGTDTFEVGTGDIILRAGAQGTPLDTDDASIQVKRGDSSTVQILWDEGDDKWKFTNNGTNYYPLRTYSSLVYQYSDDTTTAADPGNGYTRFNNATYSSVTEIALDLLEYGGTNVTDLIDSFDDSTSTDKAYLFFRSATNQNQFAVFKITGSVVTATAGVRRIPVSHVVSGTAFTDDDILFVEVSRIGNVGAQGAQGVQGAQGKQGAQGVIGVQGAQGAVGAQGAQGFQGVQGVVGAQGAQGKQGAQGVQGTVGAQGAQGKQGVQGATGAQGVQGVAGAQGPQGVQGFQGYNGGVRYTFSNNVTDADPGNGVVRFNNASASSTTFLYIDNQDVGAVSQVGWYNTWDDSTDSNKGYINITTNGGGSLVFQVTSVASATGYYKIGVTHVTGSAPANSEVITISFSRTGNVGAQGAQGVAGAQGVQGKQGAQGFQGVQGVAGAQGVVGAQGAQGKQGAQGVQGVVGAQGATGGFTTNSNAQVNSLGVGVAASGVQGEILATGEITAYASDKRLKDIIGRIENALELVNGIQGVKYKWNSLAQSLNGAFDNKLRAGVIAQEIKAVLPEITAPAPFDTDYVDGKPVSKSGENYLTVQYELLTPLLIEAIKELKVRVEVLEQKWAQK